MTNSFQAVFVMSFLYSYSTESGKEVAKIAGWAVSQGSMDELFCTDAIQKKKEA